MNPRVTFPCSFRNAWLHILSIVINYIKTCFMFKLQMATTIATTQSSNSIMHYYQEATGHLEILVLRLLMQKVFVHNRVHIQGFPLIISYRYFALPPKISLAFNWSSHSQSIAVDCLHVCIVFTTNTIGAGSGCSWLGKKSHFFWNAQYHGNLSYLWQKNNTRIVCCKDYRIVMQSLLYDAFNSKIYGNEIFFREGHSLYLST